MGRLPGLVTGGWRTAVVAVALLGGLGMVALALADVRSSGDHATVAGCTGPSDADPVVAVLDSGIAGIQELEGRVGARLALVPGGEPGDHGTEMASIIAAGAPQVRLLDVQVLDADGRGSGATLAEGIDQARRSGAEIINLSAALPDDPAVDAAIVGASDAGVAVVIAAGNEGRDLDRSDRWEALADLPCVAVVGALGTDGAPLASSNRGSDVVAEWVVGEDVAAHDAAGDAVRIDGTSPAAAAYTLSLVSTR